MRYLILIYNWFNLPFFLVSAVLIIAWKKAKLELSPTVEKVVLNRIYMYLTISMTYLKFLNMSASDDINMSFFYKGNCDNNNG